jgi:16S rRNA C967 or C1407 C5-methylase (RsmB/RsmF family)
MKETLSDCDSLVFDSRVATDEAMERGKRKRTNKSSRSRQRKRLRQIASSEWNIDRSEDPTGDLSVQKFDYVLVDSECSTDGSLKHVRERVKEHQKEENERLTDGKKLSDLVDLQKRLIESGFRLLQQGGTLVYSTCSLSVKQNEEVVQWLLENNPTASLIPIDFPSLKHSRFVTEGTLKGTIRFYPTLGEELFYGDGFFVAKLRKTKHP